MIAKNYLSKSLTFCLTAELLVTVAFPVQAQSQLEAKRATASQRIVFQENFDPPGDEKPKDTVGAGSRDGLQCSSNEQPIRPLMPKGNYGLTLEEHPSIFVDLSETSAQQVVLAFKDEAGNEHALAFLPITARSGIVQLTLPNNNPPLEVGKNYQWSLLIVCGETIQPDDPIIRGWVQRVAKTPELESELGQKSAIEQATWYAARGYWYDMLTVMVQARQANPNNTTLIALWQNLLDSVGLPGLASQPLPIED